MVKRAWNRRVIYWLAGSAVVAALFVFRTAPSARSGYVHLNPVVEALSQGRHVFGVSTSDLSIENAVALAGNPNLDYVSPRYGAQPTSIPGDETLSRLHHGGRQGRPHQARKRPSSTGGVRTFSALWSRADTVDRQARARRRTQRDSHQQHRNPGPSGEHCTDDAAVAAQRFEDPESARRAWHRRVWFLGRPRQRVPQPRGSLAAQPGRRSDLSGR